MWVGYMSSKVLRYMYQRQRVRIRFFRFFAYTTLYFV